MERRPEPELMDEEAQVVAYAEADFETPHGQFIEHLVRVFPEADRLARGVDLGCGPGDITVRLARVYGNLKVLGVDGAPRMLQYAQNRVEREGLTSRVQFALACLPDIAALPCDFDLLVANSLLHHLAEPANLWMALRALGKTGSCWMVGDLLRPSSPQAASQLVATYAGSEPLVLQQDFYNSLLAAYRLEEIAAQLDGSGLGSYGLEVTSDRHWIAYGRLSAEALH